MTDQKFNKIFPFDTPRKYQRELIEQVLSAYQSGKHHVILNAPTGIGKSAISFAVANFFKTAYVLTSQKILQEQYYRELNIPYVLGKTNYACSRNRNLNCEMGECKGAFNCSQECPYIHARQNAINAQISNFNYSLFLMINRASFQLPVRNLIICDECIRGSQLVKTDKGDIPIKDIKIGDKVYSYNIKTNIYEYKEVEQIHKNLPKSNSYNYFLQIQLEDGKILEVTPNHKIFTTNRGYVRADELTENDDIFINKDGVTQIKESNDEMKDKIIKKCQLCDKECIGLQKHLQRHHNFTKEQCKQYFNTYIEPFEHKCPNCGKQLQFLTFGRGYKKYCSLSCGKKYQYKTNAPGIHFFREDYLKDENNLNKLREGIKKFYQSEEGKKLAKLRSQRQKGENNTCHRMSEETKLRSAKEHGEKIRKLILEGKFTPNPTNGWANSRCKLLHINGYEKYYRSAWDAAFQILNLDYLYEDVRIQYKDQKNRDKIYLVDFVNHKDKKLIEVKPQTLIESQRCKLKAEAALKWCEKNDYEYIIISNEYFKENAKKINYTLYDKKIFNGMKQFLDKESIEYYENKINN